MNVAGKDEHETVVTDDGIVVPLSELSDLVPGQRVRVAVTPIKKQRRDMYGVLAGKVRDVPFEAFEEASRDAWRDWDGG